MGSLVLAANSGTFTAGLVGGGVAVLIMVWFAVRYWIATTRDPNIKDIPTPTIDRLNREALEHMDLDPEVQAALADGEPAPDDLLDIVPKDDEPAESDGKAPKAH
jgi:hypothetical protein